jgi:tripartite ATP-independent transporter DctM subunit
MNITLITILMFSSMILLLMTGRQIFIIIGGVATIAALALWGHGGEMMPFMSCYSYLHWYPLLSIPPFVCMGLTLSRSGVADKLFQSIYFWMGRLNGGLGIGTIIMCSLVAAMSGTNIAATVTASTIALPSMIKRKYDKLLLTGAVQAGGALGFLIPPSVVFILYGMIAKVSIGHLWIAGILPGILLSFMFILYIGIRCHFQPHLGPAIPVEEQVSLREKFRALGAGIPPVILIFVVLGLLFMGVTTLVECASIGATGAMVCAAINRRLTWSMFRAVMDETLKITSMVLWIFVAAMLFGAVFDGLGALHAVEGILYAISGGNPWMILIVMQLSFFVMGMVLDDTAMLLIVAPLYIPLIDHLGFSLVWFGVLYVVNCQMAFLTPPFGYNLFLVKGLVPIVEKQLTDEGVEIKSPITMLDIYKSVVPFVGIQALCLIIIMIFPQIALWLPSIFFKGG